MAQDGAIGRKGGVERHEVLLWLTYFLALHVSRRGMKPHYSRTIIIAACMKDVLRRSLVLSFLRVL